MSLIELDSGDIDVAEAVVGLGLIGLEISDAEAASLDAYDVALSATVGVLRLLGLYVDVYGISPAAISEGVMRGLGEASGHMDAAQLAMLESELIDSFRHGVVEGRDPVGDAAGRA